MFNTTRIAEAPSCLIKGKYNTKEVVDLLEPMFFGKCYLCEQDELSDPEIEHFDPHESDPVKKYNWNNLYYSCSRCNSIKSNVHKNILDCCDPDVDVFREIKCILPSLPDKLVEVMATSNPSDEKIKNTVELIEKCYNEKNTALRGVTRTVLMEKIFIHYADLLKYRITLRDKRSTVLEIELAKGRIKAMLADKFPFSVFWKWFVIEDTYLSKQINDQIS